MTTYVALLRGINVGGRNSLPMAAFRQLLTELGCEGVRTYIQSGNAVFRSASARDQLERAIGEAIGNSFGFEPDVLLLSAADFRDIAAANPYPDASAEPKSLHVSFLAAEPANPDLDALYAVRTGNERFELRGRAFYLHAPDGIGRSKLAAKVERALGVPATGRNWRTVTKLLEWL